MFYSLKDRLNRYHFAWVCRQVYDTPPVRMDSESPVAVLTQLQHKDVILFLVAIKSFAYHVALREAIILDDGSLTSHDHAILSHHIPHSQILPITQFRDAACPQGGTWERLLAIAELSRNRYVIQLDSDTLTRAPLEEVSEYIQHDTPFVIGTWDRQEIEPMRVCSERAQERVGEISDPHVQLAAEAAFASLPEVDNLNYVRGCSGFAGFPASSVERDFITTFCREMEKLLGTKWQRWGSEQVMSNVLVANIPEAKVLPHPKYSDCSKMNNKTHFIHFVGSCRFKDGIYASMVRDKLLSLIDLGYKA